MIYKISAFWKNQLNGASTLLPERYLDADTQDTAIEQYISKHYPFLGKDDYELVKTHLSPSHDDKNTL